VFNLRSALDHVAMQLWIAAGQPETDRQIQFPIFSTPTTAPEYDAKLTPKIQRLGQPAIKKIKAIEPYKTGLGHNLWVLHELNNTDKHRLLLTITMGMRPIDHGDLANRRLKRTGKASGAVFKSWFLDPRGSHPTSAISFKEPNILYAIKRNDVLFGIPKNSDFYKDVNLTVEVALGEPQVEEGDSAIRTLQDLSELVADVIDQFGRLL
jgi:hypothetical protein